MKIKTSELTGVALDWAVAQAEGRIDLYIDELGEVVGAVEFDYCTDWSQGGPIIEREGIELLCNLTAAEAARFKEAHADWQAFYRHRRRTEQRSYAITPLIAAMRCYVASKLGQEVGVPDQLVKGV